MKNNETSGITLGLLGIAFVVLKLCKIIDWSWWYVTLPFYGMIVFILLLALLVIVFQFISRKNMGNKVIDKIEKKYTVPKSPFMERLDKAMEQQERLKKERLNK